MKNQLLTNHSRWRYVCGLLIVAWLAGTMLASRATAQDGEPDTSLAEQKLAEIDDDQPATGDEADDDEQAAEDTPSVWSLITESGLSGVIFFSPLGLLSIIVVAVVVERALALRRDRVMPAALVRSLGDLSPQEGGFDPRKAYRVCQEYPSIAATVIRAMLLKIGRPHAEVEHTVQETMEREAARLYSNVRTLNLAAAVSPLVGLLGTVCGMIISFNQMSHLPPGANKSEALAGGISLALLTTALGLVIAIPAAIAAHYFEGRIQSLLRDVDELLFSLLPQVERFEGKLRVSRQHLGADGTPAEPPEAPPQPAAAK